MSERKKRTVKPKTYVVFLIDDQDEDRHHACNSEVIHSVEQGHQWIKANGLPDRTYVVGAMSDPVTVRETKTRTLE